MGVVEAFTSGRFEPMGSHPKSLGQEANLGKGPGFKSRRARHTNGSRPVSSKYRKNRLEDRRPLQMPACVRCCYRRSILVGRICIHTLLRTTDDGSNSDARTIIGHTQKKTHDALQPIRFTTVKGPSNTLLLHGPYQRYLNDT